MINGRCELCGTWTPLHDSHIIPNWVYRDEIRGPGGAMIDLSAFKTHSKAMVLPLLCDNCEQLFSKWEKPAKEAASKITAGMTYGDWLLKFAVRFHGGY